MSANDLHALFANLRPSSQDTSAYGQPSSQSPPPPFNPATIGGTTMTSNPASKSATAQSLLNLLNFGSNTLSSTDTSTPPTFESSSKPNTNRAVSASDLVARLVSPGVNSPQSQPFNTTNLEDQGGGGPPRPADVSSASQDALLKLLNKAQPSRSSRPASVDPRSDSDQRKSTASVTNGGAQDIKPLFTYQNPFEQLNASRQQTPKASTPVPKPSHSPIFKGLSDIPVSSIEIPTEIRRTQSPSDLGTRKILTPRSASARAVRLARESSTKSTGALQPDIEEEIPAIKTEDLPIRGVADVPAASNTDAAQFEHQEDSGLADAPADESPQVAADEWEDAEESPTAEDEPRRVPVYNFPIKPFVSLTLELDKPSEVHIREDGVMEISRLKKDFDPLDRSLAAATTKYIAYALVKNGGIRIIRQDDGTDRQVFKHTHDRVFNLAFCTTATQSPASNEQAVLGTGISGTVYYATISKDANDLFEKNQLDTECLAFPPWPPMDDTSATGTLTTRARRSSRHPEFFAIGRGKSIRLIWPANSMCSRYGVTETNRQVDMDKLYQDRNLQISTGKAGKDFTFSEDDTLIVSLDKTGRLRFWDIRELTDETNATSSKVNPIKVEVPLLSLSTASPAEKAWPTSVHFVDKSRPYIKGGALRYVLVGLRQNHTLQLWDVALGKAVQELNLPPGNEPGGVCSVNYHPASGIIVIGHPTRNSLFFIHLSAPRYTLSSSTSQAAYIQRVASKDPEMPRPESTACMSGLREISFASKGQLRSVELLSIHKATGTPRTSDEKTGLFELYVVHSKGVTFLTITKEDLGWDANNKVIHGVDAATEGVVSLKELKLGGIIEEVRSQSPPEEPTGAGPATKTSKKKSKKGQHMPEGGDDNLAESNPTSITVQPLSNGLATLPDQIESDSHVQKDGRKSTKKKAALPTEATSSAKPKSRTSSPAKFDLPATSTSNHPQTSQTSEQTTSISPDMDIIKDDNDKLSLGVSGDWLDKEVKKIQEGVSRDFKRELNILYSNIQNDRMMQDSTAIARQEAVLRLVSSTLTSNVDKSLASIIATQIQGFVLPAISNVISQVAAGQIGEAVAKTLHHLMPRELSTQVPAAVNAALSSPQISRAIAENVSFKITKQIEVQVLEMFNKHIFPATKKQIEDVEARMSAEIQAVDADRKRDIARVEKFGQIIEGLSATIQTMSENQIAIQNQIAQEHHLVMATIAARGPASDSPVSVLHAPIARPAVTKPKTQEDMTQEEIADLMSEGKYESASVKWLQTDPEEQVALFDNLFVRFTPEYMATDVSSLVAFSIAITVGASFQTNTARRLEWILAAFHALDVDDPEINDLGDHGPGLMSSVIQKLEGMYSSTAERDINDPILGQLNTVAHTAREIRKALSERIAAKTAGENGEG